MPEYDMPIEEQIKVLVKEFRRTFKESVETRFDSVDTKLTTVDNKVTTLDTKVTTLDSKIDKVQVLLEDTHAIAKLGLEGVKGLRESTDEKFAAAAKTNAEQTESTEFRPGARPKAGRATRTPEAAGAVPSRPCGVAIRSGFSRAC